MPLARFERLVEGLPVADAESLTLAFSGFGEPLVHPDWHEMMRVARERQHRVEVITNGLLLDAQVARALVELGVAQVTVSVDGGDEAAYARMRGVPAGWCPRRGAPPARSPAPHPSADGHRRGRGGDAQHRRQPCRRLLDWASDLKLDFVSIGNLVPHTEEMAREILWERAGWASVFRQTSWRPQVRVGRFDVEDATRPARGGAGRARPHLPVPRRR